MPDSLFSWLLPPRPGFPGFQPSTPQQPPQPMPSAGQAYYQRLSPAQPAPKPIDAGSPEDPGDSGPVEPYIPSRNDRPYKDWGTDDFALAGARNYPGISPGPFMPQARDLAPLLHGIVMGIGRWGSHYSAMPAIAMGTYASAYWTAYQKGMHQRAGDAWQQYQHAQQMFLDRQAQELREAKDAYALYENDPGKLHEAMHQIATKYGDQTILNALGSGNYGAIDKILQERDKSWQDAAKIKQQQEAQKLIMEERRLNIEKQKLEIEKLKRGEEDPLPPEWRDNAGGGGGGAVSTDDTSTSDTDDTSTSGASTTRTADTNETSDSSGDTDAEGTPLRATAPATTGQGPAVKQPAAPAPAVAGQAINPLVKEAADEMVRSGKRPQEVPKGAIKKVDTEAAKQKAALANLMDKGGLTGDDENKDIAAIRKINPRVADDVQAMGHYIRPVPVGGENLYASMENLVRKVYPHWDPRIYRWIEDFSKSSGPEQKMLTGLGVIRGTAEAVFDSLKDIDPKSSPIKNWIDYETGKVLTGDPKWNKVGQAFYDYTMRSLMSQNGGNRVLASQMKFEMERFPLTMGPRAIMAMMAATAKGSLAIADTAINAYHGATKLPREATPGYDEENIGWIRALSDLDYETGYTKGNVPVPDDMKPLLGPAGSNLHRVKTTGPMGPTAPPTKAIDPADVAAAKKWLADPKNANDPNRAAVEEKIRGQ